jgi:hypothetical protein
MVVMLLPDRVGKKALQVSMLNTLQCFISSCRGMQVVLSVLVLSIVSDNQDMLLSPELGPAQELLDGTVDPQAGNLVARQATDSLVSLHQDQTRTLSVRDLKYPHPRGYTHQ